MENTTPHSEMLTDKTILAKFTYSPRFSTTLTFTYNLVISKTYKYNAKKLKNY